MMLQMSCSDVLSSSVPLRKTCTIRYPKHSLEPPWSILIANLAQNTWSALSLLLLACFTSHAFVTYLRWEMILKSPSEISFSPVTSCWCQPGRGIVPSVMSQRDFFDCGQLGGFERSNWTADERRAQGDGVQACFACCGTSCSFPQSTQSTPLRVLNQNTFMTVSQARGGSRVEVSHASVRGEQRSTLVF